MPVQSCYLVLIQSQENAHQVFLHVYIGNRRLRPFGILLITNRRKHLIILIVWNQ